MPLNRPIVYTALNSVAMFTVGLVTSQKGPSFNDLILIANTDVEGGSFFVLGSNFGYMLGSVLCGFLFERVWPRTLVVAVAITFSGIFTALTPWCSAFAAMVFISALTSMFSSGYETAVTTLEIQAWDGSGQSAMQFLSFSYSLGGIFGPLISEPFMAPKQAIDNTTHNANTSDLPIHISSKLDYNSGIQHNANDSLGTNYRTIANCLDIGANCSYYITDDPSLSNSPSEYYHSNNQSVEVYEVKSNLHYAYLITGCLSLLVSILFYTACIKSQKTKRVNTKKDEETSPNVRKVPRKVYIAMAGLAISYFYFHTMAIDSFGQYLFYFVVTHLDWDKQRGAILVSMFWGLAMSLKLLLVFIYRWVRAGLIFFISVCGIVFSLTLFAVAGQFQNHTLIWVATACQALSQASIFGGGFAWIDGNLIRMDGRMTSLLFVGASLGALSAPIPLGYLMKKWTLMVFPYSMLCLTCISATIFLVLNFIVKPLADRKYGPLRSPKADVDQSKHAGDSLVGDSIEEDTRDPDETGSIQV